MYGLFDWLLSLSIVFPRFNRVIACICGLCMLWAHNTLFYGWTTFYLFVHSRMDIWTLSTSSCYECVVMDIRYKLLYGRVFSFVSGICGGLSLLGGWRGHPMFNLLRLFSKVAAPSHVPTASYEGSDIPTSSSTLVTASHFHLNHLSGCDLIPRCGFDLHFPDG